MKRFVFLISLLLGVANYSAFADKNDWGEGNKCPPYFKVYVEGETLYLNPLRASAAVQILDEGGTIVYEEFILVDQPQLDQPQLYMIPVDYLPSGNYTVLIAGEQGNYSFGFYL